jgi:hypothetical protein
MFHFLHPLLPPPQRPGNLLEACRAHPGRTALAALALLVVLAIALVDVLAAKPLRHWAERAINAHLQGYQVKIAGLRLHTWRLGLTLEHMTLVQNRHPDPPVADIEALDFSLLWRALRHFKLAGDLTLEHPALHINLPQIKEEIRSKVSLRDQGWQGAVESIYPFKLDRVAIQDGSLLYLADDTASKPIRLTRAFMVASNVRNIAVTRGTYPSPVSLEAVLFDTGRIQFQGAADFLRKPYAAVKGKVRLDQVPFDRLAPIARDYQVKATGGVLSLEGAMESTPEAQTVHLAKVLVQGLNVDYVTSLGTQALEAEHARQVVKLAQRVHDKPHMLLQVDHLRLTQCQFGFVNEKVAPPYRLFISDGSLALENLSNQAAQGRTEFKGRGAFMGRGRMVVSGAVGSTEAPVDFAVQLHLDDAHLPDLNDFLLASAGVDVAEGQLSVYAELTVRKGRLDGYFKPLIKDLKVYDRRKDQGKPFGRRVEMHVLQALAGFFKNRRTRAVATVTHLSGPISGPKVGEWEAIRKLIGNGLFSAIRPGFLEKPAAETVAKPGAPQAAEGPGR